MPIRIHFRRVQRGQYVLEILYNEFGDAPHGFYLLTWTIKLGFRSSTCSLKANDLSCDDALEWVRERFGVENAKEISAVLKN